MYGFDFYPFTKIVMIGHEVTFFSKTKSPTVSSVMSMNKKMQHHNLLYDSLRANTPFPPNDINDYGKEMNVIHKYNVRI